MADDSDEDDYVFYGTSLHDEGDTTLGAASRPKDPAAVRSLPVHQQEVTDEQGRKRFHGAFTGGYSAGYFNTVGSKEGWQPSTFTSSRSDRTQQKQQRLEDFLDEDELQERGKTSLQLKGDYDTFGSTAAELARSQAAAAAAQRPSVIPGPVPAEFFAPVTSSIGVQLLQKMGWRPGKGLGNAAAAGHRGDLRSGDLRSQIEGRSKDLDRSDLEDDDSAVNPSSSKWGTVAGVSMENTPMYVLEPKQDLHGLGFDPFEGAEEFRSRKRQKLDHARAQTGGFGGLGGLGSAGTGFSGFGPKGQGLGEQQQQALGQQRQRGVAFGTGVLEDTDTLGYMEDYVDQGAELVAAKGQRQEIFAYEEASESDDEDRFNSDRKAPAAARIAAAQHDTTLLLTSTEQITQHGSFIPGFKAATELTQLPVYPPPKVPDNFVAFHSFETPAAAAAAPVDSFAAAKAAAVAAAAAAAAAGRSGAAAAAAAAAATAAAQHTPAAAAAAGSSTAADIDLDLHLDLKPVDPPEDVALRRQIDGLAAQVVRSGSLVEQLAKQQAQRGNSNRYQFLLDDGGGQHYYKYKLQQLRAAAAAAVQVPAAVPTKAAGQQKALRSSAAAAAPQKPRGPLSISDRMALLGETPLPASAAPAAAGSSGSAAAAAVQNERPRLGSVAATDQQRLAAALGSQFVRGSTQDMGDEYQKLQEAIAGLRHPKLEQQQRWQQPGSGLIITDDSDLGSGTRSAAAVAGSSAGIKAAEAAAAAAAVAAAAAKAAELPVRTFEDWRPAPLLCKRFNVPDPYKGRAAPVEMPRFKSEYLALPDTAAVVAAAAAADEERRRAEWQQQQQQQEIVAVGGYPPPPPAAAAGGTSAAAAAASGVAAVDEAASFLGDIMEDITHQDAITAAAQGAAAAAAAVQAASAPQQQREAAVSEAEPPAAAAVSAAAAAAAEEADLEVPMLEKPLDLFKAIFEYDESEDDANDINDTVATVHTNNNDSKNDNNNNNNNNNNDSSDRQRDHVSSRAGQQQQLVPGLATEQERQQQQGQQQRVVFKPKTGRSGAPAAAVGQAAKGLADAFMRKGGGTTAAVTAQQQEILDALAALRSKSVSKHKNKEKKKQRADSKSSKKKHKKEKGSKDRRTNKSDKKSRKNGSDRRGRSRGSESGSGSGSSGTDSE